VLRCESFQIRKLPTGIEFGPISEFRVGFSRSPSLSSLIELHASTSAGIRYYRLTGPDTASACFVLRDMQAICRLI
jgi:hypothetical protein